MDILSHLSRTVTPAVIGNNGSPEKEGLLKQFYALFVGQLADQDSYNRISGTDFTGNEAGFFDHAWNLDNKKANVTRELAVTNGVDESTTRDMLVTATPLAFQEIKSLAGSTPIPQFLRDNLSSFRDHIPAWASVSGLVPAGLLAAKASTPETVTTTETAATTAAPAAAHVKTEDTQHAAGHRISDTTSNEPLHHHEKESGGGFLKALLPIIGLIILAALAWALLKGCQEDRTAAPVATETTEQTEGEGEAGTVAAALAPAALTLATGEGNDLYACRINAGNEELSNSIISAVQGVFDSGSDKCNTDVNDDYATDMPAAEQLAAILPLIKDTPNANVIIEGDEVRVDAPEQAQLDQLVADLKEAAPGLNIIAAGPLDLDAEIENSIAEANSALDNLGDNPDPKDVARALSLQVINFAVDKSDIPDANKEVLDRAVNIMKKVPEMELLISGHTDSQGDEAYNQGLSERRAQAVKDYLVSQGADESKLTIRGMGQNDPIATNETENGRFRNRRIEFTVYDESTMSDDGIKVAADSDISEQVTDAANSAGDKMTDAANSAGNSLTDMAKSAGSAVGDAADTAGSAVKEGATTIKDEAEAVVNQ